MSATILQAGPYRSSAPMREAKLIQAVILLITCGLTVLVTAVLGPSLPAMQAHFAQVPGADYLVPLTLTAPMLTMAVVSIFAGEMADRIGRKRLMVAAALLYALVGTAPLYLDSLYLIIVSRVGLGVIEGTLMTVSTTMIGDYFDGVKRQRIMSLQTTVAATSAFLFNALGGAVAEFGWRAPYAVFGVSLLLAPLMAIFLWEPRTRASMTQAEYLADVGTFRIGLLVVICALTVLLGMEFLTVPVHFGYLFTAIGTSSPSRIGLAYAVNSLGVISGTLTFGWVLATRLGVYRQLAVGCVVAGLGFAAMSAAGGYLALTAAGFMNGFGSGILLPAMVTWNMRELPLSRRGLGVGAFQSCLNLGMFLNPLLVVGAGKGLELPRASVVGLLGAVLCLLAAVAWTGATRRART